MAQVDTRKFHDALFCDVLYDDARELVKDLDIPDLLANGPPTWEAQNSEEWVKVWDIDFRSRYFSLVVVLTAEGEVSYLSVEEKVVMVL